MEVEFWLVGGSGGSCGSGGSVSVQTHFRVKPNAVELSWGCVKVEWQFPLLANFKVVIPTLATLASQVAVATTQDGIRDENCFLTRKYYLQVDPHSQLTPK